MSTEIAAGQAETLAGASPRLSFVAFRYLTLGSLILGYMGYYLCRQNFADAHDALARDLHIDNSTFGTIATTGVGLYAAGKFFGGALTDSLGGRRMFFVGLFGSVVATVLLGLTGGFGVGFVFLAWGINRAFQSLGWSGIMKMMSRWFTSTEYGTASGSLAVSYQLGGFVASVFVASLVAHFTGWRILFFGPALVLTALGLGLLATLKASPHEVGYPEPQEPEEIGTAGNTEPALSLLARVITLLGNPAFALICLISFVLTFIRESLNTWLPAYLASLGDTTSDAILKSSLYPLLGCAGTIGAGWLSDRFFRRNRGPVLVLSLACAAALLFGMGNLPALCTAAKAMLGLERGTVVSLVVGMTGFFILAPYSMVGGGVFALDHGGRKAPATAVGLLDGFGYIGGMLSGWGVGKILSAEHDDWRPVFNVMTWAVVVSTLLSVVLTLLTRSMHAREHG